MESYQAFLADDLAEVQRSLDAVFRVEGRLMQEVADYVGAGRGKMLRPAFVCLSARAFGYDPAEGGHARLGASLELFHVATLLHDDVIDEAPLRRSRATVNAKWGNDVAILFADYLYASSFDLALSVLRPEIVQVLSKTTQKMTEGEMYQIEKRGAWLTVADYLSIIRSKTAYLFSACAGLGAMVAGQEPDVVTRLFDFGLNFGMAFQITDDALDYEAQGPAWGKRVGADLKEGKQTLPLLHALQQATPADREKLLKVLNNGRHFDTVHHYVKQYNGIDFSLEKAGEFTRAALEILEGFEENEAFGILKRITDGVLVRTS
ncbi:polyprenyl synthetase family protein [soil metagenome]